ncbi:MAG: hypothetical protein KIT87_11165 [Anaerolineae bacterium]|nr:hypothetical protein [Anaerolineae bacterium]
MRWVVAVLVLVVGLGEIGPVVLSGESLCRDPAYPEYPTFGRAGGALCRVSTEASATATPFPLYLPYLGRAFGGTPTPRPTPTLPPPIIADPYPGTICPVQGGTYICWPSARYTLSRGPGEACGSGMTPAYYLVSESVNLELYQGRSVLLRGDTVESPNCVPLLRVTSLEVPTPTP